MLISEKRLSVVGACAFALTAFATIHHASAASWSSPGSLSLQKQIVLVDNGGVMPSQRPRYLSGSAGATRSRFAKTDTGSNAWGLHPIMPAEGIVTLKSGETYRTAAEAGLGSRAAGASHGHALPASEASTL